MNKEPTNEEMTKTIEEFAKINPDDFEYIQALSQGYEGWLKLSSGKEVYVSQPRKNAAEIGEAFREMFNRINNKNNCLELGISTVNKSLEDIFKEISKKWKELTS